MDILFVQTQNQLYVIFSKEFQQVLNINSLKFYFYTDNTIYQIDQVTQEIIFYRFTFPRCYIQPKKKYIYLFSSQSQAQKYFVICHNITYKTENAQLIQNFDLEDNCQNSLFILFSKTQMNLINDYQIYIQSMSSFINISIVDKSPFNSFCRNLVDSLQQEQTLLYYENYNQKSFSLFKTKNYIQIKSCSGQFQFKIPIQQQQVLQHQNIILLWQKDNRILKLIQFQVLHPVIIEYKFKSVVINILQFQEIIYVSTKNEDEYNLFDLKTQSVVMINQNVKSILDNLYRIYLLKNQQSFQYQAFFYSKINSQVIQLFQHLLIVMKSQVHIFDTDYIQIVYVNVFVSRTYYIIGIHLIENYIIEQFFDGHQISTLNQINLNNYEIIKPLLYQINDNYLAIVTRSSSKNFIIVFLLKSRQTVKLIKIIAIGRIQFFLQEQYLFYYDLEDNIQKFNMRDFEISIELISSGQHQLININSINFQIIPRDTIEDTINLEVKIQFYNDCFQLMKKDNHVILRNKTEKSINININDYIIGPIDNVKILNNDNIQIEGPLLLSEEITNFDIPMGVKLKRIYLGAAFKNLQNVTLFQSQNNEIVFFLNRVEKYYQQEYSLQNIILINDQSLLFLFNKNNSDELKGVIYLIDVTSMQLIQQPVFEMQIQITLNQIIKSFKTGNLLIIKNTTNLKIFQITESEMEEIKNQINIIEILKIQGDNQLYISLSLLKREQLQFYILSIYQSQLQVEGVALLLQQTIDVALNTYFFIKTKRLINQDYKLNLLKCTTDDENLYIKVLQSFKEFSIISEILIIKKSLEVQFKPLMILRNLEKQFDMDIQYVSNNHLIFQSYSFIYIYNLKDLETLNYIGRHNLQNQYTYQDINTTHFIVFDQTTGNIFIGKIGYQIKLKNETQNKETFTLLAKNNVSSIQIEIFLQVSDDQSQNQTSISILLFILGILLVIYFFIRRMQLKSKQINNQNHTPIVQES